MTKRVIHTGGTWERITVYHSVQFSFTPSISYSMNVSSIASLLSEEQLYNSHVSDNCTYLSSKRNKNLKNILLLLGKCRRVLKP